MIRILARTMVRTMVIRTMLRIMALELVVSVARLSTSRSTVQASRNGVVRMLRILSLLLMKHFYQIIPLILDGLTQVPLCTFLIHYRY